MACMLQAKTPRLIFLPTLITYNNLRTPILEPPVDRNFPKRMQLFLYLLKKAHLAMKHHNALLIPCFVSKCIKNYNNSLRMLKPRNENVKSTHPNDQVLLMKSLKQRLLQRKSLVTHDRNCQGSQFQELPQNEVMASAIVSQDKR